MKLNIQKEDSVAELTGDSKTDHNLTQNPFVRGRDSIEDINEKK